MQMKIVLPVDGSEYTRRMLAYVAAHNELLGSDHEYFVLTVVPSIPGHVARYLDRSTLDDYYRDRADEVLQPVRKFLDQQKWQVRVTYVVGQPADAIAAFVETNKPDLIVMGTHGHTAMVNLVLGSVTTGVLARCKVPVLLIQ